MHRIRHPSRLSSHLSLWLGLLALFAAVMVSGAPASAQQPAKPNIIVIMGDDIGWANIGVYNQGIMAMRTPNLDKFAQQGVRFDRAICQLPQTNASHAALLVLDQKGDLDDVEQLRRLAAAAGAPFVLIDPLDPDSDRYQPLWGAPLH